MSSSQEGSPVAEGWNLGCSSVDLRECCRSASFRFRCAVDVVRAHKPRNGIRGILRYSNHLGSRPRTGTLGLSSGGDGSRRPPFHQMECHYLDSHWCGCGSGVELFCSSGSIQEQSGWCQRSLEQRVGRLASPSVAMVHVILKTSADGTWLRQTAKASPLRMRPN